VASPVNERPIRSFSVGLISALSVQIAFTTLPFAAMMSTAQAASAAASESAGFVATLFELAPDAVVPVGQAAKGGRRRVPGKTPSNEVHPSYAARTKAADKQYGHVSEHFVDPVTGEPLTGRLLQDAIWAEYLMEGGGEEASTVRTF
jgi:hypothetical protein